MSLSLKAELEIWATALKAYDEQDFEQALDQFSRISDSSKILTNIGLIYATIGEHKNAVEHFVAATNLDSYLAIAHFQCGVSNFLLHRYDLALLNFEDAHLYLRGNEAINYDQLGLKFKLFSAEIMFNKGLVQLYLGYVEQGMADMHEASRVKVTVEHGVIDEAIRDRGEGYTVFSIPVGVLYRPSENKLKNSKSKDYLGKAKLVAAAYSSDAFTEFTGVVRRQQASAENAENKNTPNPDSPSLKRCVTLPPPRLDPISPLFAALERSKTSLQPAGFRPSGTGCGDTFMGFDTIKVSPPASQCRSNTPRLPRDDKTSPGVMPLRIKTSKDASADGENGPALLTLRNQLSHRRLKSQGASPATPSLPFPAVQPGQYVNPRLQDVRPFPPSAEPPAVQEGHLTRFYNTYMDVYTNDHVSGFVASEYEELEMANIRVKLHYQGDVRGMTMPPTTSFNKFVERVTSKFGTSMSGLGMKFTDEDGTKISLRDEGDFELAVETARESAKGRSEGKIEVWCVDV